MKHRNWQPLFVFVVIAALAAGCSRPAPQQAAQNAQTPAAQPQAAPGGGAPAAAPAPGASPMSAAPAGAPVAGAPAGAAAGSTAAPGGPATPAAAAAPATPPPPPKPREVTLAAGTEIQVQLISTLSTKTNKAGEGVAGTLVYPIADGDWVIAPTGAAVSGVIVTSDPGGRVKGVASMSIKLTKLTLADGRTVQISTSAHSAAAKSGAKKDVAKVGVATGAGAIIGGIAGGGKGAAIGAGVGAGAGTGAVLATRGDPAVIPASTLISFKLTEPITVTKK
jgi:hypothetical protein